MLLNRSESHRAEEGAGDANRRCEVEWDRTLTVRLKAMWYASKRAIPHMIRAGGGAIVTTSSVHSLVGFPEYPAYAASYINGISLVANGGWSISARA